MKRIPCAGGFYVQTPAEDWAKAFERMKNQAAKRDEHMSTWEKRRHPGHYPSSQYWEAYYAERAKYPVDYPMPEGHVMFGDDDDL